MNVSWEQAQVWFTGLRDCCAAEERCPEKGQVASGAEAFCCGLQIIILHV